MIGKLDVFILSGKSGKEAYNRICNAKPLSTPQYSKKERDTFNKNFLKCIPDIINNWNNLSANETK